MKKNNFNNLKTTCHTRPDRISRGMIFNNKEYHTAGFPLSLRSAGMTESGRSMVEMLGVLAVIGVLSVAGIAGYSNAMKKYRANELLNEVSKRATIVAMQITSGRAPNISEFGNNVVQGITITANSYTAGAETFSFGLSSTGTELSDICPKMTEAVGENSFMSVAEGCGTITFKTDLSAGGSSSNEPVATCTPACQTGEECVDGICMNMDDSYDCGDGNGCLMKTGNTYTCLNDANDEGYYADITNNNRCALISDCVNSGGCLNFVDDISRKVCGAECIHHQVVKGYQGNPDKYDIENNYYATPSGYYINSPKWTCQPINYCHNEAWHLSYNSGSYSCWECSDDGCSCIVGNTYYPDYNNGGQCASVEACTSSGGTLDDPDQDIYTCVH